VAAGTRADQLRGEIEADRDERERVAGLLSVSIRRRYEQVFARRGGLAVVEMRGGICVGCNMAVPPQLANEIRKGQTVNACPSCHRILYWRLDSDESSAKEA
jgi:predicted  nucleic acid-binding Zn-ribbon protein